MSGVIRVQVRGCNEELVTREVPRGTSAIEVLKNFEGVKRAIFARVKYQSGARPEMLDVVDTDALEGETGEPNAPKEWKLMDLAG